MSLQNIVAKATSAAFRAVGDLAGVLTIRRETPGEFDPMLGIFTPGVIENFPCRGIIVDYSREWAASNHFIESGDQEAILDAATLETIPVVGDTLVSSDDIFTVMHIETVKPNAHAFIYKLQVRGQ
ncbi:hypothetical protein [Desulfonatronum thioautotrophicum]|uniref:hypothetical protein n=1 Tax=Desulfonatronum thioautotrophicum TaxID=617001 RepID=UPI0005EB5E58|nr:hypothetical protein [Desulfonatronum thioautotrophicum]